MESIRLKNNLIYYYGSPCGYVKDNKATIDSQFNCEELNDWCSKSNYEMSFAKGVFDNLVNNEDMSQFSVNEITFKNVRIWQLKADSDFSMRFISFAEFEKQFGQPCKESYNVIFDGNLQTNNLEQIYGICNYDHPEGYNGHSLSMSDVVELYDKDGSSFHYVDRFGFKEVDFDAPEQKQTFEMKMQL